MEKYFASYSCDFETCNKTSEVKIATFIKFSSKDVLLNIKNDDIDKVNDTRNIKDMIELIIAQNTGKRKTKKIKKIELWYTNSTKFDGYFIRSFVLSLGLKQSLNTSIQEGEFAILEPTKIGIMTLRFIYDGFMFILKDFKLIESLSVKQKGEVVGIEKGSIKGTEYEWLNKEGEIDWQKLYWDKLNNDEFSALLYYAKKDALIDCRYLIHYFNTIGRPEKLTKSGKAFVQAEKTVKEANERTLYQMKLKIYNDDIWTAHYYGGMNYINPNWLFVIKEYAKEYDKINMYVGNMTEPLPIDGGSRYEIKGGAKLLRIKFKYFNYRPWFRKNVGQGFIPAKRRHHLDFEYDFVTSQYSIAGKNYICEVWEKELIEWQKCYDMEYEILEVKYFRLGTHLKPWMIQLYNDRNYYKELMVKENYAINYVLQNDKKTEGNSVYGILGEKDIKEQYYYSKEVLKNGDIIKANKENRNVIVVGKSNKKYHGYFKYITRTAIIPKYRKNIYIASYVTMLGRTSMYDHILTGLVGRCDTDGFTADKTFVEPKNFIQNVLGGFKLETEKMARYFMLFGYKAYSYSHDGAYHKEMLKFKGIIKLKISEGTPLDKIQWHEILGESINGVETETGKSLVEVEKRLTRQVEYLRELKKRNSADG